MPLTNATRRGGDPRRPAGALRTLRRRPSEGRTARLPHVAHDGATLAAAATGAGPDPARAQGDPSGSGPRSIRTTARSGFRSAEISISPNTRRAYSGRSAASTPGSPAGRSRDATWPRKPSAELRDQDRAPVSAATAVAAARFRARFAGEPSPAGERTAPGPRRLPADRRRSRPGASAAGAADLAAVLAACRQLRRRGRESEAVAEHVRLDDRGAHLHGWDAAERGEHPPVDRQVAAAADGDGPVTVPTGSKDETRRARRGTCPVREGCRRSRGPDAAGCGEPRIASCRFRRR